MILKRLGLGLDWWRGILFVDRFDIVIEEIWVIGYYSEGLWFLSEDFDRFGYFEWICGDGECFIFFLMWFEGYSLEDFDVDIRVLKVFST